MSGVGRELATPGYRGVPIKNVIQTDAAINPGACGVWRHTAPSSLSLVVHGQALLLS